MCLCFSPKKKEEEEKSEQWIAFYLFTIVVITHLFIIQKRAADFASTNLHRILASAMIDIQLNETMDACETNESPDGDFAHDIEV